MNDFVTIETFLGTPRHEEVKRAVSDNKDRFPFAFLATSYNGLPRDVPGSFMWVPSADRTTALFLFESKKDRDALAARFAASQEPKARKAA